MSRSREPLFNFAEPVPVWVCGLLIAAHALMAVLPEKTKVWVQLASILASYEGEMVSVARPLGAGAPLLLHGFLHADWSHVFMNSAMIAVFGILICRAAGGGVRGAGRFLTVFLMSIVAGGLVQLLWWALINDTASAVGASGGASGLLAAAGWVLGGKSQMLRFGLGWLVINALIIAASLFKILPMDIAWAAHLGGFVGGAILSVFFLPPNSTSFVITR